MPTVSKGATFSSFEKGTSSECYRLLGAHAASRDGKRGMRFRLWAPEAKSVSVAGQFNGWEPAAAPMKRRRSGVWELFLPGIKPLSLYKYCVTGQDGVLQWLSDPCACCFESSPEAASVIDFPDSFRWGDKRWRTRKEAENGIRQPISICRVSLPAGRQPENWETAALVNQIKALGFTYLQLSLTGRPGHGEFAPPYPWPDPRSFMAFVNNLHKQGLGILLEWSPKELPEHPEQRSMVLSNALYWLREYHVDGLCLSADRFVFPEGTPKESPEGVGFLQLLTGEIGQEFPAAILIGSDFAELPALTRPVRVGGLGLSIRWHSTWEEDVMAYLSLEPPYRGFSHDKIIYSMLGAMYEQRLLPLESKLFSPGEGTLLEAAPGTDQEKHSMVRALLIYQFCHPGKKLLSARWNDLLHLQADNPMAGYLAKLHEFYKRLPPLWEIDNSWDGVQWLVPDDAGGNVIAFRRLDENEQEVIGVFHFSTGRKEGYRIGLPNAGAYEVALCSSWQEYGGTEPRQEAVLTVAQEECRNRPYCLTLDLPPLTGLWLVPAKGKKRNKKTE